MSSSREQFLKDPLAYLDSSFNGVDPVTISPYQLCIGDPPTARKVLANAGDLYDTPAFFAEERFGRRHQQTALRAHTRALFRHHLDSITGDALARAVDANITASSDWPDAGNSFFVHLFRFVLLYEGSPRRLSWLIEDVLRATLAGAASRTPRWKVRLFIFKRTWLLSGEIKFRKRARSQTPRDFLDAIISVAEPHQSDTELTDVFAALVASISTLGFVLGWAVYLLGTEGDPGARIPSEWIVCEALRLWPLSWLMGRIAKQSHEVAGRRIKPGDEVIACPYLVNRHKDYWPDATQFRPERWADPQSFRNPAFLSFGYGTHRCPFADHATEVVSRAVDVLRARGFTVLPKKTLRPLGPIIYPPAFTLHLND